MARLSSFLQMTLDGCYADAQGDIGFAHRDDAETRSFVAENARGGGALVFGRTTYEMMARYWPTPLAQQNAPEVAQRMNALPKFVVSKSLKEASWNGTRILGGDLEQELRTLKAESPVDLAVLGSGSLVAALGTLGLIDRYDLMINPVILGEGKRLFAGVLQPPRLALDRTRAFGNGCVFASYLAEP
jgi:dihydrofolate reductase